jgi:nicotinamide phosphoribosyltransferase
MGTKDDEIGTFRRLLNLYPEGILSIVSDTWNLWTVCTEYLPVLKEEILARKGKLVIRPDSGDPVDIICGTYPELTAPLSLSDGNGDFKKKHVCETKGVIELLWDVFGGTINKYGYKELDSHIGAIYGDSITLERAEAICERLKAKGFASTNVVFGIGSFTYQYNTRDTLGFAVKATYGEVNDVGREIFKDPITDDGTKRSAKGLIKVEEVLNTDSMGKLHHSTYRLVDQVSKEEEEKGALELVFSNGSLVKNQTLSQIRERLAKNL